MALAAPFPNFPSTFCSVEPGTTAPGLKPLWTCAARGGAAIGEGEPGSGPAQAVRRASRHYNPYLS